MRYILFILITLGILPGACFADTPEKLQDLLKNEVKWKLNEQGNATTKLSLATQFWTRTTQLNDGSTTKTNELINSETDFALRRTRLILNSNLNDRLIFYTQLGFNNLSAASQKPQIYFHDVWAMFRIIPKSCYVGFGLNGWGGISRLSNTSFQKTLTLDNPGINYPNVNHTDIENRQLGIFTKGTTGRLSYRAALSKPFAYNGLPAKQLQEKGYEYPSERMEYKGYFAFHFLDKEYFNSPYVDMTYLGTKRICNLGAGFDIYPQSIAEFDASGSQKLKNRNLFATDLMLELPIKNNQTVSVYSVWYSYDFGRNYLRLSGVMNNWSGGTKAEGAGNNEFKAGTGTIWYSVAGYLFPQQFLRLPGRIQLFYAFTDKRFEALSTNLKNHDLGANYYVAGQKLKFSFQYSLRPILNQELNHTTHHLPTAVLQVQLVI